MDDEQDEEPSCPICFETYEEQGENVARTLSCGGVVCEKCISELISEDVIECPECGAEHSAEKGVYSFPIKSSGPVDDSVGSTDVKPQVQPPMIKETTPEFSTLPQITVKPVTEESIQNHQDVALNVPKPLPLQTLETTIPANTVLSLGEFNPESDNHLVELPSQYAEPIAPEPYLLDPFLQVADSQQNEDETAAEDKCKIHGIHPFIYCEEPYCKKAIELLQSQEEDIVDAEDEQFDTLFSGLESTTKRLTSLKSKILNAMKDIARKNDSCLEKLNARQQELLGVLQNENELIELIKKCFEEMTAGASNLMGKLNKIIEDEVTAIDEHLNTLDSIKETTHSTSITRTAIEKELETIKNIETQVRSNVSDTLSLKYLEYNETPGAIESLAGLCAQLAEKGTCERLSIAEDVESLCGHLRQRETCVHLAEETDDDDLIVVDVQVAKKGPEERPMQKTCDISTVSTKFQQILFMNSLHDGTVVVCGKKNDMWKLTRFNLELGAEVSSATLGRLPSGMTDITLNKHHCVALSYRETKEICFHDINNLQVVVCGHSVARYEPNAMCSSSATTLLYVDSSRVVRDVRWLDCSEVIPKPAADTSFTATQQNSVSDMCCMQDAQNKLIVTTRGSEGISAYSNRRSGRLEWNMKGELLGMNSKMCADSITTDGRGHFFVCDSRNKCIQIFSPGGYKGAIWTNVEHSLGVPMKVRWCAHTSSLNVLHVKNKELKISKVEVNVDKVLRGDQIKREAPDETSEETELQPPSKRSRWDASSSRDQTSTSSRPTVASFKCEEICSTGANYSTILHLLPLHDSSVIITCKSGSKWTLIRLNTKDKRETARATLRDKPEGLALVTLIFQKCLVVSYSDRERIDFHHMDRLKDILCSYKIPERHQPGYMCATSPSVLLYEDKSVTPRAVRWLNCSASPPKPCSGKNKTATNHATIRDMCCLITKSKQLVFISRAINGMFGYDTKKAKTSWNVRHKLTGIEIDMSIHGVTSDNKSHVFACDVNNSCVHMFSSGGRYMGALLKDGSHGIAQPWLIRWSEHNSSLVIVHIKDKKYRISVIKVTASDAANPAIIPTQTTDVAPSRNTSDSTPSALPAPTGTASIPTPAQSSLISYQIGSKTSQTSTVVPTTTVTAAANTGGASVLSSIQAATSTQKSAPVAPLKFKGALDIGTKFTAVHHMCSLTSGGIVVCGERNNDVIMIHYNIRNGAELDSLYNHYVPDGMIEVKMAGKLCIALAFTPEKVIEFHNANNLKEVLLRYPTAFSPALTCVSSSSQSTLLISDHVTQPAVVKFLYCSTSPMLGSNRIKTHHKNILGLCTVQHSKKKQLLVTTCGSSQGIMAYNTSNSKLEWQVKGSLPRMAKKLAAGEVTTDGCGHLFVVDYANHHIQMFKTDGVYLGAFEMSECYAQAGGQWRLSWSDKASALIIARKKRDLYHVEVFKVTDEPSSTAVEDIERAPEYNWEVTRTRNTSRTSVTFVSLAGETVVLCSKDDEEWRLSQYDLKTGAELSGTVIADLPWGMSRVSLGERPCVVLSYMTKKTIDFHCAVTLSNIIKTHSVHPHLPSRMCAKSPGPILLYEDVAKIPHEVRWLDCSTPYPAPVNGIDITHTQQNFIQDMCYVATENTGLLVTTKGIGGGIYAYSTKDDKLVWSVEGILPGMDKNMKPLGIASDGSGHLFVTDNENKCILTFSTEGEYMGVMLRDSAKQLVQFAGMCWSEGFSALVTVHMADAKCCISTIQDTLRDCSTMFQDQTGDPIVVEDKANDSVALVDYSSVEPQTTDGHTEEPSNEDVIMVDDASRVTKETTVSASPSSTYKVLTTVKSAQSHIGHVAVLPDGRFVMCCYGDKKYKLVFLDDDISALDREPQGMAHVVLNEKNCIALSFAGTSEIHFYNLDDQNAEVVVYNSNTHRPGRLCTASASVLLYVNQAHYPCTIHWLHCGGSTPKPVTDRSTDVTHTRQASVQDVCCVEIAKKSLVIVAHGHLGVFAYNASTDSLEWNLQGKPPGMGKILSAKRITVNKSGHLFVCDYFNDCLQMFTLTGQYMGAVTREEDLSIVKPWLIQWCRESSALVVVHLHETENTISKLRIDVDAVESQLADVVLNESAESSFQPEVSREAETNVPMLPPVVPTILTDRAPSETSLEPPPIPSFLSVDTNEATTKSHVDPAPHPTQNWVSFENLPVVSAEACAPVQVPVQSAHTAPEVQAAPMFYNTEPQAQPHTVTGEDLLADDSGLLHYKVTPLTRTGHRNVSFTCPVGGTDVIVCGMEGGHCSLTKYNLQSGLITDSTTLQRKPDGLTTVLLNGRQRIAMSYTNKKVILFYDAMNCHDLVHVYSTTPSKPGRLCTGSLNTLLYEDRSSFPCTVKWLDCWNDLPRPVSGASDTRTQQGSADDMCCIHDGDTTLVVVTKSLDGIYAYDAQKNTLAWKLEGPIGDFAKFTPESVVSDDLGHVYIGDQANSCIQVFNADGSYLDVIFKDGNMAAAQPPKVTWCNSLSSLLVVHMADAQFHVSVIHDISGYESARKRNLPPVEQNVPRLLKLQVDAAPVESFTSIARRFVQETVTSSSFLISSESLTDTIISAVHGCSIVVCGKVEDEWKLVQCWPHGNVEIEGPLGEQPIGMTAVNLGGNQSLAMSFKASKQIIFYNLDDINKMPLKFSTSPDEPGRLCTSSPTVLLYEDQSQKPRQMKWLDCTDGYPTPPATGINITYTRHASLVDVCCVRNRNRQLVVTARGFHGIDAYNMKSSKLEWSVIGKLPGMAKGICAWSVTTDGSGQVYVGDKGNTCVQVVASDGLHLRTIRKTDLGQLLAVRWLEESGLICTYKKDGKFYVATISENEETESESEVQVRNEIQKETVAMETNNFMNVETSKVQQQQQTQLQQQQTQLQQQPQQQQLQQQHQQTQQQQQPKQQQLQQQQPQLQQLEVESRQLTMGEQVNITQTAEEMDSYQEISVTDMETSADIEGETIVVEDQNEHSSVVDDMQITKVTESEVQPNALESMANVEDQSSFYMPTTPVTCEWWPPGDQGTWSAGVQPRAHDYMAAQPLYADTTVAEGSLQTLGPYTQDYVAAQPVDLGTEPAGGWKPQPEPPSREEKNIYDVWPVKQLEHSHISFMSVLDDSTLVLCGIEFGGQCKLSKYRTQDFSKLDSTKLKETPWGMAVVTLGNELCVALTYSGKQTIDFHNADELTSVLLSYSAPRPLGRVFSTPGSTILHHEDRSPTQCHIKWLDCSVLPPKVSKVPILTLDGKSNLNDMCYVQHEEKRLMVLSQGTQGIHAYNTTTDEVEWSLTGKSMGLPHNISTEAIDVDNAGNIYICDSHNACIHVCSASGAYITTVLREHSQGLSKPWKISWWNKRNCLIVAHMRDKQYGISVMHDSRRISHTEDVLENEVEPETGSTKRKDPSHMLAFTIKPATSTSEPNLPDTAPHLNMSTDSAIDEALEAALDDALNDTAVNTASDVVESEVAATAVETPQKPMPGSPEVVTGDSQDDASLTVVDATVPQTNEGKTQEEKTSDSEKPMQSSEIVNQPEDSSQVVPPESHVEISSPHNTAATQEMQTDDLDQQAQFSENVAQESDADPGSPSGSDEPLPPWLDDEDLEPGTSQWMDLSYEAVSDSDLPEASAESDHDDSDTSLNDAIQLDNFKVASTARTEHSRISFFVSLRDDSVAICSMEDDCELWKLTKYSLPGYTKQHSSFIEKRPDGMSEIMLGKKHCVAVSYLNGQKIDFHSTEDLREIVYSHTVKHKPSRLCAKSPAVLLYEDRTRAKCAVRWLNCTIIPPRPIVGNNVTSTKQNVIWDMCCVDDNREKLLVTTSGYLGVIAYNLRLNKKQWRVKGKKVGKNEVGVDSISTDGCGRLFVCGYKNASIWIFSTGGTFLATLMRQKYLGDTIQPWSIAWNRKMSALIAVHTKAKDKNFHFIIIKEEIQQPENKKLETTINVDKSLQNLSKDLGATSLPTIDGRRSPEEDDDDDVEISVTEDVGDLERIRENLLKDLEEVPNDQVTSVENAQASPTETMATAENAAQSIEPDVGAIEIIDDGVLVTDEDSTAANWNRDENVFMANTRDDVETADVPDVEIGSLGASSVNIDDAISSYVRGLAAKHGVSIGKKGKKGNQKTKKALRTIRASQNDSNTETTAAMATDTVTVAIEKTPEDDKYLSGGNDEIHTVVGLTGSVQGENPTPSGPVENENVEEAACETEVKSAGQESGDFSEGASVDTSDSLTSQEKDVQLKCKVVNTISTEYKHVAYMCALPDSSVVVCGKKGKQWKLTQYGLVDGAAMCNVKLTKRPDGLALVKLADTPCVALSYMNTVKIEFRDASNLNTVVHTYIARQCRPMRICASPLSSLLFIDHKAHPHEAKRLECNSSPPEQKPDANVTKIQQDIIWDLCSVTEGGKNLLVITGGFDGVCAYDTDSSELTWCVKGNLETLNEQLMAEGVTSDGRGQLFISDESNGCIHKVSMTGSYEGVLLKEGESGLGKPRLIHYCDETSSLVVVHLISEQCCISRVEISTNSEPSSVEVDNSKKGSGDGDQSNRDDALEDGEQSRKGPKKGGKSRGKGGKRSDGGQGHDEGQTESTDGMIIAEEDVDSKQNDTRAGEQIKNFEFLLQNEGDGHIKERHQPVTEDEFLDDLTQNISNPVQTIRPIEIAPVPDTDQSVVEHVVEPNNNESSGGKRKGEPRKLEKSKRRRVARSKDDVTIHFPYQIAQTTVVTTHCRISYMAVPTESRLVVCSKDHDIAPWRLIMYDTNKCKEEIERVTLSHIPDGLASVRLEGRHCVAVSYVDKMQIDFHDANALKTVVYSHLVSPHRPGRLFSAPATVLLYEDQSKEPREVCWLNCATTPPKLANPALGALSTHTQQDIIWDMCCIGQKEEKLVIATKGYQGIFAYNANADKLQWHVKGKLKGMEKEICAEALTTDRNGHLFVCDRDNECVQILTFDGTYLGPLFKENRQSMEFPLKLRWNTWKSSLLVAHAKIDQYAIQLIPVRQDELAALKPSDDNEPEIDLCLEEKVAEKFAKLKFKVVNTVTTEHEVVSFMSPLVGNSVVVCGRVGDKWKLHVYNLQYGSTLSSVKLPNQPDGMTVVTLGGRSCLALSYTGSMKIIFHDVTNLHEIVCSYSVAPHCPGPMHTASPTTLLYEDSSKHPLVVRWLDCSGTRPRSARGVCVTHTHQTPVCDMSVVRTRDTELLITTCGQGGGIYGYNTSTDERNWIVQGALNNICAEAVTTDEDGNLFVCDTKNACILVFKADGSYVGCALKAGEQGLGGPLKIRWCESISSLAVVHIKNLRHNVSLVKVASDLDESEIDLGYAEKMKQLGTKILEDKVGTKSS